MYAASTDQQGIAACLLNSFDMHLPRLGPPKSELPIIGCFPPNVTYPNNQIVRMSWKITCVSTTGHTESSPSPVAGRPTGPLFFLSTRPPAMLFALVVALAVASPALSARAPLLQVHNSVEGEYIVAYHHNVTTSDSTCVCVVCRVTCIPVPFPCPSSSLPLAPSVTM